MGGFDIFVRAVALCILLFVVAFLALTFCSFWWEGVFPLRQASFFAMLSVLLAGVPVLLVYLTRAAGGAARGDGVRARYFLAFVLLLGATAVVTAALMMSSVLQI